MTTDRLMQERIARNDSAFRDANEDIEAAAEAYGVDMAIPFVCECANPRCNEIVRLRLDEYEAVRANPRHFLNVPGHEDAAAGVGEVVATHDHYVVVEKQERAGEIAEALDERTRADASPRASAEE